MGRLDSTKQAPEEKEVTLKEEAHEYGRLELQFRASGAGIGRREGIMCNFAKWVRTGHTLLAPVQASSYLDQMSALFRDPQMCGEYIGGYHVGIDENGDLV